MQNELSLKVMRLSRPSFVSSEIYPQEECLPFGETNTPLMMLHEQSISKIHLKKDEVIGNAAKDFVLSDLLMLPQSFGNIHLGKLNGVMWRKREVGLLLLL